MNNKEYDKAYKERRSFKAKFIVAISRKTLSRHFIENPNRGRFIIVLKATK